ncbi:MAG: ATP-dependent sacrificial sulfur transferase LarE [Lachnospiraceae bacterium]|nr:ATP-dependent sacrificial sulfur transferase LarE [Lachnospiraceae bacterium]
MTLEQFFKEHPKTAIAFSGGTDSSYLLYMAKQYAEETVAVYMKTPFQPEFELEDARHFCTDHDIPIIIMEYDILQLEPVAANPADRCYYCKMALFTQIRSAADEKGFPCVADGTNASDDAADRPGMRALKELGIFSPLRLSGITKDQVRDKSRKLGLFTADKPAYACLATRIPTGTRITAEILKKVEQAETALMELGFYDFRVRVLENGARLEMKKEQIPLLLENKDDIFSLLQPLFGEIYLDFEARG